MDDILDDFDVFCKNTYSLMINYCRSREQNKEDAEEIVNEAYSRMWRAWDRCGGMETVKRKQWMYSTINYIILEQKKRRVLPTTNIDEYIDKIELDVNDNISEAFEDMKYEIYLKRARETLTENERQLFDEIVINQRSYSEAARALCISEDAVRARMVRLRKKIELNINKILK